MSSRDALVAAGVVVGVAEMVAGGTGIVLAGPGKLALLGLISGLFTVTLSLAVRPLLEPAEPSGGAGGAGVKPDPEPPPPWWPGFEADFWAHVRDRERSPA